MSAQIASTRSVAVDIARFVAAAAVVWIHVPTTRVSEESLALFRFAVPFFTCALVYFTMRTAASSRAGTFADYAMQRVQRLYLPFLLWSAFYLLVRFAKHAAVHSGSPIVFSPAMLLTGTTHHLWFLPFAALASLFVFGFATRIKPAAAVSRGVAAAVAVLVALGFAFAPIPEATVNGSPIAYFLDHAWRALPSIFLGASVFWFTSLRSPTNAVRWSVLALGMAANVGEIVGFENAFGPHFAGAALLYFTCTQARPAAAVQWNWAEIAFLVYLSHVLFIESLQTLALRMNGVTSVAADISVWALALALSVITAQYTLQLRALRRRWLTFRPRLATILPFSK